MVIAILLCATSEAADSPGWGGSGYFSHGFVSGDVTGLTGALSGDYTPPGLSQTLGGGGHALLGGRALLLGQGYGLFGLVAAAYTATSR